MTTLTLRYIKGDFVVTGSDIEPLRFKTRREAKDWCKTHYPGSLIKRLVPGACSGVDVGERQGSSAHCDTAISKFELMFPKSPR